MEGLNNTQPDFGEIEVKDGRKPLEELGKVYDQLESASWRRVSVCTETVGEQAFTVYAYLSPQKSQEQENALWIIGGIHGEEPAGPNAFAEEIGSIRNLTRKNIPVVFVPMANPWGYAKDWRYPNERRDIKKGQSVTDCDYLLSRRKTPSSSIANNFMNWVIETAKTYKPFLVANHHEDEMDWQRKKKPDSDISYSYAYGDKGKLSPLVARLREILVKNGFEYPVTAGTRFKKEKVENGVVFNAQDGSIDEYLEKIYGAQVLVIETAFRPDGSVALEQRVNAHRGVIKNYAWFWNRLKEST